MDPAEQFLVQEIRRGGESAWRQLIDRYHGRLHAFVRSRCSCLSDAEDLVQETFIGFLQSLPYYNPERSLETYLFTILRHKLYDLLRRQKATTISAPPEAEDWWDRVLPESAETPSDAAVQAESLRELENLVSDLLQALIHELRDRQAFDDLQVIELVFYADMRNLDVADLMEMDQKAVAGIKFRAIQRLQKFLAERDPPSLSCLDDGFLDVTVARVWRERRLTCLKRSTIGSYVLGVLDEPWKSYTQFHLDVVGCPLCVANLNDLQVETQSTPAADAERIFQSSVGFIRHETE